jgi:hypothetical protein
MQKGETHMLRVLLTFIIVIVPITIYGQASSVQGDEVLIVVPAQQCYEATRVAPSPIHFYHRLSDSYLVGTSRLSLLSLRKRGIDFVIVEDKPWTSSYALVSRPHPGQTGITLEGIPAHILYKGEDYVIVKGTPDLFRQLRAMGYACVEIERVQIPFDPSTTRLPEGIGARMRGIVDSVIAFVSDTSLQNSIQAMQNFGTRYWNNANRDSVARWVRAQYLAAGVSDVRLDSFQYSGTWQTNVVATILGILNPAAEFIVGGHHDSYSSNVLQAPGADDNASGAAAAIEMARVLKLMNYQPAYTMRFMGFAAEEAGLRGSASYAQRARQANRDIRAMLNYDMIGYRNQAQGDRDVYVVWYTGAEALSTLHSSAATVYTLLTPVLTTSYRSGSDSYSFWQQNYKAVFLIERDFNPYYHTPNDLLPYLDMPYCADIVRSGLATLVTLDQLPPSVAGFRLRDRGNGTALFASWDSVAVLDFSAYKIYVGRTPGVYDTSFTQTTRSRLITGLTEGVTYYVGVAIVDLAGLQGFITELSATPRSVPLPPAGLTTHSLPNAVKLTWRRNEEMDLRGYNVYRTATPTPGAPFILRTTTPTPDTSWIDSVQVAGTYAYYTTAVDSSGLQSAPSDTVSGSPVTSVGSERLRTPFAFTLYQNYPNPFNPSTMIKYEIGSRGPVELKVLDVLGREISTLVNETKEPGVYAAVWDAANAASGVYFVRLKAEGRLATIRVSLVK